MFSSLFFSLSLPLPFSAFSSFYCYYYCRRLSFCWMWFFHFLLHFFNFHSKPDSRTFSWRQFNSCTQSPSSKPKCMTVLRAEVQYFDVLVSNHANVEMNTNTNANAKYNCIHSCNFQQKRWKIEEPEKTIWLRNGMLLLQRPQFPRITTSTSASMEMNIVRVPLKSKWEKSVTYVSSERYRSHLMSSSLPFTISIVQNAAIFQYLNTRNPNSNQLGTQHINIFSIPILKLLTFLENMDGIKQPIESCISKWRIELTVAIFETVLLISSTFYAMPCHIILYHGFHAFDTWNIE